MRKPIATLARTALAAIVAAAALTGAVAHAKPKKTQPSGILYLRFDFKMVAVKKAQPPHNPSPTNPPHTTGLSAGSPLHAATPATSPRRH